ncbi:MAG: hypothetical protein RMJ19_02880 [Gemmatales bacterium]|nr:HEPN domain-containing protein [Gemmatales bacterium]MDW8174592.1 hypothetical protein [Gemmatales bacterium]
MTFNWREYLELARAIQGQCGPGYSQEAADRTAISRAYYAAFGTVREYARRRLGYQPSRKSAEHGQLITYLGRRGAGPLALAQTLSRLRLLRNQCDYDDAVPGLALQVIEVLELAEVILRGCMGAM